MIRVAMLSFWHVHARDYLRQAQEHPETQIVATWDELPERGRTMAQQLGVPFYSHLNELLAQADIDAVIIDTPTTMHRDCMLATAQAGKHIFTEKVLAPTLHECHEVVVAVVQAGIKLTISLPRLNAGYTQAIQDIIHDHLLGDLSLVRVRLSHHGAIRTAEHPNGWLPEHFYNPEQSAGGAMIDLGCHPIYLVRLFLGLPQSVDASFGYLTGRAVEDNAVVTLRYPQGAMGVAETGFVNRFSPFSIEVHGTEGSLLYGTPHPTLLIRSAFYPSSNGSQWHEYPLPADRPSAFEQWVSHIQQGTTASENIQLATDLSMLMEAASRSARNNQSVSLASLEK